MKPASSDGFHSPKIASSTSGARARQINRQNQGLHEQAPHQRERADVTNDTPGTLMMAPRKPTADSAKTAAATSPMIVGFSSAKPFSPPGLSAVTTTPTVSRSRSPAPFSTREMIAEKNEAEDRGLDRLGLRISRRHHEGAVVHREQHQGGGDDLAERAEQQPWKERRWRPWKISPDANQPHPEQRARTESRTGSGYWWRPRCRAAWSTAVASHCARPAPAPRRR